MIVHRLGAGHATEQSKGPGSVPLDGDSGSHRSAAPSQAMEPRVFQRQPGLIIDRSIQQPFRWNI